MSKGLAASVHARNVAVDIPHHRLYDGVEVRMAGGTNYVPLLEFAALDLAGEIPVMPSGPFEPTVLRPLRQDQAVALIAAGLRLPRAGPSLAITDRAITVQAITG